MKLNLCAIPDWLDERDEALLASLGHTLSADGRPFAARSGGGFSLHMKNGTVLLQYATRVQFYRGLGLLAELEEGGSLKERPLFARLGVMLDASRGAVPLVRTVKEVIRRMAVMGYNELMLYTEDTYEVEGQPWFGYLRGGYNSAQIREIDEEARHFGVELIPCVQTLAHLDRFLHWPAVKGHCLDAADVLLADSPDTDILLEQMFRALRGAFSSRRIHIGMDEAMGLGLGRHLAQHGYEPPAGIMARHLKKVCALAQKYGFSPMMWSDMFFRLLSENGDYYDVAALPEDVKKAVPDGLQLVYWDYYHDDAGFYRSRLALHERLRCGTAFAGGGWSWLSPVADYGLCLARSLPALEACKAAGTREVFLTLWGDDGAEASVWGSLLSMQLYAEFCFTGAYDEAALSRRFAQCCGTPAAPLAGQSRFNRTGAVRPPACEVNAAKFLLYQDPLLGILDEDARGLGFAAQYASLAEEYAGYAREAPSPFCALYDFYAKLAAFLADKAELGLRLRGAYEAGDKTALRRLATQVIPRARGELAALKNAWRALWVGANHPIGFEVHDIRLGGVDARLETAATRIDDFLGGSSDRIEELETTRMPYLSSDGSMRGCYFWQDAATACKL